MYRARSILTVFAAPPPVPTAHPTLPPAMSRTRCLRLAVALQGLLIAACTPYAVHTTAQPLAKGEHTSGTIFTVVPAGARLDGDSTGKSMAVPSIDWERRMGLDDRSDVGLRINSFSGAIVSYKRRLDGPSTRNSTATALLVGAGLVNWGQHAHAEVTLVTSASDSGRTVVPYGGFRAVQVAPLSSEVPHDKPTLGLFGGTRLGGRDGGISLEVGVFYDRSALGMRKSDLVVVPSVAVHGLSVRRLFSGVVPRGGPSVGRTARPCFDARGCGRSR